MARKIAVANGKRTFSVYEFPNQLRADVEQPLKLCWAVVPFPSQRSLGLACGKMQSIELRPYAGRLCRDLPLKMICTLATLHQLDSTRSLTAPSRLLKRLQLVTRAFCQTKSQELRRAAFGPRNTPDITLLVLFSAACYNRNLYPAPETVLMSTG